MAHEASRGRAVLPIVVPARTMIGIEDGQHDALRTRAVDTADQLNRQGRLVAPDGSLDAPALYPASGTRTRSLPSGGSAR